MLAATGIIAVAATGAAEAVVCKRVGVPKGCTAAARPGAGAGGVGTPGAAGAGAAAARPGAGAGGVGAPGGGAGVNRAGAGR
jgi:hypothetical protein